jgi:hypothetical protein
MTRRGAIPLFACLISAAAAPAAFAAQSSCQLEVIKKLAPQDAVIDSVTDRSSPVAHCEVLGHIITQNPGPNRVEWSVMLPKEGFKGRYYFIGEGAAAGFVPTAQAGDGLANYYAMTTVKLLSEGFAVAGSDTGHKGMMWDFGVNNPAGRLDHAHRGAHLSAVATQAITRGYYSLQEKLYRYHLGCSGGGRMGAMAVVHHPEDYDGVVVSTGFGEGGSLWFPWDIQHVVRHPDAWISPEKLAFMERKVHEKCAGPDGLIHDPNVCGFDPATLLCKGESTNECLTAAEMTTVKRITERHPTGPGITSGGFTMAMPTGWSAFLIGNTRPTNTGTTNPWAPAPPPPSYTLGQSILRGFYFNRADYDMIRDLDFNNKADLQKLHDGEPVWSAVSDDISAFKKAGGKLILWAGIAENAVPPATEIDYFNIQKKKDPGADDFVRLYLAPDVMHCAGGNGPQDVADRLLEKVIAWAEDGKRPDAIVASAPTPAISPTADASKTFPAPPSSRTTLLCPYPQMAVFKGKKGDFPYDADNWTCR